MDMDSHHPNSVSEWFRRLVEADPSSSLIEVTPGGTIAAICDSTAAAFNILPVRVIGKPLKILCDAPWAEERLAMTAQDKNVAIAAEVRSGRFCYLFVTPPEEASGTRLLISRVSVPPPAYLTGPPWLLHHTWGPLERLTRRQIEVLRYVALGHDNARIAAAIFKTRRTVEWHLRTLYRGLPAGDRLELFRIGHQAGLASIPESLWAQILCRWPGGHSQSTTQADDTLAA